MTKPRYTYKTHVHRLKLMLKRDKPCVCCPAQRGFVVLNESVEIDTMGFDGDEPCNVCLEFLGISNGDRRCPCYRLGKKEALIKTYEMLELWDKGEHPVQKGKGNE